VPKFLYSLPYVRPAVYGGFFVMSGANEPIVRRSWGLRERERREEATKAGVSSPGSTFAYSEFLATPSRLGGIAMSLAIFMFGAALSLFAPARWLAKKLLPVSGGGPPREKLESGWFEVTNVAEAEGVVVKSVVKGQGDPGYYSTARKFCVHCRVCDAHILGRGRDDRRKCAAAARFVESHAAGPTRGDIDSNNRVWRQSRPSARGYWKVRDELRGINPRRVAENTLSTGSSEYTLTRYFDVNR
jgi:hypothetical protein